MAEHFLKISKSKTCVCAYVSDQCWTDDDIKVLKENNIIYDKHIIAIYIDTEGDNPLFYIGYEDDGKIVFHLDRGGASCFWLHDLLNVTTKAIDFNQNNGKSNK